MAASYHFFATIILALLVIFRPSLGCFTSIVSFGDSLTDTGNYLLSNATPDNAGHHPYGETYFHHPTGRCSDGRLIIDFIAEAMGLPHLPPSLSCGDFTHGVNFAVAGVTAIESSFYWEKGIKLSSNYSLDVQIEWFRRLLPSLCDSDSSDCSDFFRKTLFVVGEIGGNDYHIPLFNGKKLDEIRPNVPRVIGAISSAIDNLIELGAKTLIVPSYLPVGCLSGFLTLYHHSSSKKDYDPRSGCLRWLNKFAEYHNRKLVQELARIRKRHPSATVVYADYYHATMRVFQHPRHYGFGGGYLSACCGGGGPFNYNSSAECGTENARPCSDPSKFIVWDGMHLTEAAYKIIARQLVGGPVAIPAVRDAYHVRSDCSVNMAFSGSKMHN